MTAATRHSPVQRKAPKDPADGGAARGRGRRPSDRPRRGSEPPSAIAAEAAAEVVVEELIQTPCHPIDPGDRSRMEAAFGDSFADVRVHHDSRAGDFAADLRADAFTLGQHVFFGYGRYRPGTPEGRRLLAHELAHTLQQRGPARPVPRNRLARPDSPATPNARLEAEAESAAAHADAGRAVPPGTVSLATPEARGSIARRSLGSILRGALSEVLDPARLNDAFAENILRRLRADPDDRGGKVRLQMAGLSPFARSGVLDRLEAKLDQPAWEQLVRVLEKPLPEGIDGVASGEARAEPADQESDAANSPPEKLKGEPAKEAAKAAPDAAHPAKEKVTDQAAGEGAKAKGAEPGASEEPAAESPTVASGGDEAAATAGGAAPQAAAPADTNAQAGEAISAPAGGGGGAVGGGSTPDPETLVEQSIPATTRAAANAAEKPQAAAGTAAGELPEAGAGGSAAGAEPAETATAAEAEPATMTGGSAAGAEPAEAGMATEGPAAEAEPVSMATGATAAAPGAVEEAQASTEPPPESETAAVSGPPVMQAEAPTSPPATPEAATPTVAPRVAAASMAAPAAPAPTASPGPQETSDGGGSATGGETGVEAPGASAGATAGPAANAEGADAPGAACMGGGAAAQPAADEGGGGGAGGACGGGGGGGGGAPPPPEAPAAQDLASQEPAQAMASVASLPPKQMLAGLGGVSAAASRTVGEQRSELQANPPEVAAPPTGAPRGRVGNPPPPEAPISGPAQSVDRAPAAPPSAAVQPSPAPVAPPQAQTPPPKVTGDAQQKLTESDVAKVQAAVKDLPTTDPALEVDAGPAPELSLEGDADPQRVNEQRAKLNDASAMALQGGRQDAAQPLGEDHIYPEAKKDPVKAAIASATNNCGQGDATASKGGGGGAGGGGGEGAGGDVDQDTVSVVAQQEHGDELHAAAEDASGKIQDGKKDQQEKTETAKKDNQAQIDEAVRQNAEDQTTERQNARAEVMRQRNDWTKQQQDHVDKADADAVEAATQEDSKVRQEERNGRTKAEGHLKDGNEEIRVARVDAEKKAADKKAEANKETNSGGILGWISDKIASFFNAIVSAIHAVFDLARKAVKFAIEKAQKLAAAAIDLARRAIVDAIKWVGDRLIALGDVLLAAFPELRDKFRKAIRAGVDAAVDRVNKLADALNAGIQKLLNFLGDALNAILSVYECLMIMAVSAVRSIVQGVLDAAKAAIMLLGEFAGIIKDIISSPGAWFSNLGRAMYDGVRNCLWPAFKSAIREWFDSKVQAVLGLGRLIWNVLVKGCITLAQIGSMVWKGLVAALPRMVLELIAEKVVQWIIGLLFPAAGAAALVLEIIRGIKAAWGAISRIIAAVQKFVAFLKAVKVGGAAGLFASAVASGAVAVIDIIANYLLDRMKGAAKGTGDALRKLGEKLMKVLGKVVQAVKKVVTKVVQAVGKAVRYVGRLAMRGVRAVGRGLARVGRYIANSRIGRYVINSPVGRAIRAGFRWGKQKYQQAKQRIKKWYEEKRGKPEERMERARRELPGKIAPLLHQGMSTPRLWVQLGVWKISYGLRVLRLQGSGTRRQIVAANSPPEPIVQLFHAEVDDDVRRLLHELGEHVLHHPVTREEAGFLAHQREGGAGRTPETPLRLRPGSEAAASADVRRYYSTLQPHGPSQFVASPGGIVTEEALRPQSRSITAPYLGNLVVLPGASYPQLTSRLGATGLTAQQTFRASRALAEGRLRDIPTGADLNALAELNRILHAEGARSSSALTQTAMLRDIGEAGRVTLPAAFADPSRPREVRGGVYGPSIRGAVAGQFGLAESYGYAPAQFRPTAPERAAVSVQAAREIELAALWVESQMAVEGLNFYDVRERNIWVETKFEERLKGSLSTRFLRGQPVQ